MIAIYSRHILVFTENSTIHGIVVIQGKIISDIIRLEESEEFD
jgi:hypothetical protein